MARPQYDTDIVEQARGVSVSDAIKNHILAQQELESIKAYADFAKSVLMYKVLSDDIDNKTRTTICHSKDKLGLDEDLHTEQIYVNDSVYDVYAKEQVSSNTSSAQIRDRLQSMLAQAVEDESAGRNVTCNKVDILRDIVRIVEEAKSITTYYRLDIKPK